MVEETMKKYLENQKNSSSKSLTMHSVLKVLERDKKEKQGEKQIKKKVHKSIFYNRKLFDETINEIHNIMTEKEDNMEFETLIPLRDYLNV